MPPSKNKSPKANVQQQNQKDKKKDKKRKIVEPDSDSEEESEEEQPTLPVVNGKKKSKKNENVESAKKSKKKKTKVAPPPPESSDESEEEDDDSSEEETQPVKVTNIKTKGKPAADDSSEEEESDEEDEEESSEEESPKPVAKPSKSKKQPASKANKEEESSEEEDDEEEEDSSEDEQVDLSKNKKKKSTAAEDDSDEEDEDDDEDEEDSDEESEEEMVVAKPKEKKRKAAEETPKAAKKHKPADDVPVSIFVKNLPEDMSDEDVAKFFEKKGVVFSDIRRHKPIQMFADLEDSSQIDIALECNGKSLSGQTLLVEKAKPRNQPTDRLNNSRNESRTPQKRDDEDRTLFVKGISFDATEDDVHGHFDGAESVRMPTRPDGSYKGFAFVTFSTTEEADSQMEAKQGSSICGRSILLDYCGSKSTFKGRESGGGGGGRRDSFRDSRGRGGRGRGGRGRGGGDGGDRGSRPAVEPGTTKLLFVKNLSFDSTQDSLAGAFENCVSARVATHRDTGNPRGFGFIEFATPQDAVKAYESMQSTEVDGRAVTLDYASEKPPGGGGDRSFGSGGRGGGRGGGGRGRGGGRGGRGGRGGSKPPSAKGTIQDFAGKKKTFDD